MPTMVPIKEIERRLRELGISQRELPMSTVRRWSAEGLLPRPDTYYTSISGGPGKHALWPLETVEHAAAVYYLRHSDVKWAKSSKENLLRAKQFVDEFYASVDKFNRVLAQYPSPRDEAASKKLMAAHSAIDRVLKKVDVPPNQYFPNGARGMMYGSYELHPLIVSWIVALEKIRHHYTLFKPARASFNWNRHAVSDLETILRYDGVSVEPAEDNTLSRHMGATERAKQIMRARIPPATEPSVEPSLQGEPTLEREKIIKVAEKDNISVDIGRQWIIITNPKTRKKTIIDLSESGVELVGIKERGPGKGAGGDRHAE